MAELPALLKRLTGRASLTLAQALKAAKVLMPKYATEAALARLTADDLVLLGLEEGVSRKVANALGKPSATTAVKGGKGKGKRKAGAADDDDEEDARGPPTGSSSAAAASSGSSDSRPPVKKRTRKAARDMYEIAVEGMGELGAVEKPYTPLNFGAHLSTAALVAHEVRINRAPILTAWTLVVCLRLGFDERESLSLAHSFTDVNATSKAVSLGLKHKPTDREKRQSELSTRQGEGWHQPHVILMGRKPVMTLPPPETDPDDPIAPEPTYRALSSEHSTPVQPALAARYLHSSLSSSVPYVLRAMTLVAQSWTAEELQGRKGWEIYLALRPEVEGWGKKGVVQLESVLALAKDAEIAGKAEDVEVKEPVKGEDEYDDAIWETFDFAEADLLGASVDAAPAAD